MEGLPIRSIVLMTLNNVAGNWRAAQIYGSLRCHRAPRVTHATRDTSRTRPLNAPIWMPGLAGCWAWLLNIAALSARRG